MPGNSGGFIAPSILGCRMHILCIWNDKRFARVVSKVNIVNGQRRYDMRHEMLTQRAHFCIGAMAKKGTLSQHFMTHVVPPLVNG